MWALASQSSPNAHRGAGHRAPPAAQKWPQPKDRARTHESCGSETTGRTTSPRTTPFTSESRSHESSSLEAPSSRGAAQLQQVYSITSQERGPARSNEWAAHSTGNSNNSRDRAPPRLNDWAAHSTSNSKNSRDRAPPRAIDWAAHSTGNSNNSRERNNSRATTPASRCAEADGVAADVVGDNGERASPKRNVREACKRRITMESLDGIDDLATEAPCEVDVRRHGSTSSNRPVQLIRMGSDGKCCVQQEGAAFLSSLSGQFGVVSMAGLHRTGKSFLLNRIRGRKDGFDLGTKVDSSTKGIWIWGKPITLESGIKCLLLYTNGLGTSTEHCSSEMALLATTLLLSSLFICNSVGPFDDNSKEDLLAILQLASGLHDTEQKQKSSRQDLAELMPSLLWVARDLPVRYIAEQQDGQYLERKLAGKGGKSNKLILQLFKEMSVFMLPRAQKDDNFQKIDTVDYLSLRPEFRDTCEAFCRKVNRDVTPKTVAGSAASGQKLLNLVSAYCEAINAGSLPVSRASWRSSLQHQLRVAMLDAMDAYRDHMIEQVLGKLPMDQNELRTKHEAAKQNARQVFRCKGFPRGSSGLEEYMSVFEDLTSKLYGKAHKENMTAADQQCTCTVS